MTRKRAIKAPAIQAPPDDGPEPSGEVGAPDAGIPAHVWAMLQTAGEQAAERLVELLEPRRFNALPGSVQRALLDLALTRAYGLPVRRSVEVRLSSSDTDAVAASLSALRDSLPERRAQPRDVTPETRQATHVADAG